MTTELKTQLAKAPWPAPVEVKPKEPKSPVPRQSRRKIDANFEDWAKKEGIDLKSLKLMNGG